MINQIILVGNVGTELTTAAEGKKPFAMFNVAVNKHYTPKGKDAEKVTETHWHKVVCYKELAGLVVKLIGKGDRVLLIGELTTEEWKDKEGNMHRNHCIIAHNVILVPKKTSENVEAA